jgi:hypothetical protein
MENWGDSCKRHYHLDEISTQFDLFNLKKENEIKGFDPSQLFMTHMTYVGYSVSFAKTFLFGEEEGDSQNPQGLPVEKLQEDIETIISTTDQHRQRGRVVNERSSWSPNVSQKSGLPKGKPQNSVQEQRKSSMDNSDDGGEQNPPKGNLENPHKLPIASKRKRGTNKEGESEDIPGDEIVPEDMELDVNIEEIEFAGEEQRLEESKTIAKELATQEPIIFEEESLTLHHATFNKNSRKLVIEKINAKNKKIQEKWNSEFDFHGVPPSKVIEFHEATGEALKMSIGDIENENSILKDRVRELENALMPPPLFSSPIATIQPLRSLEGRPESSSRLKGTSSLLAAIRRYVGENIQKRMSLILETWELATSFVSLGSRMTNFRQYLQADLENDEEFYKGAISTFVAKVSGLSEFREKKRIFLRQSI